MMSSCRAVVLFLPLLLILANQVEGQGGLMQGMWDFAVSVGVDPTSTSDDGAFPPDSGAFPPDSGAFPPDSGAFPPDSGAFPPDSGAFPPDSGAFPQDSGVFPPDSGLFSPDSGQLPTNNDAVKDSGGIPPIGHESIVIQNTITGVIQKDHVAKANASQVANENIPGGSIVKVDSTFTSEATFKIDMQDSGVNNLIKPITGPAGAPDLIVIPNTSLGSDSLPPAEPIVPQGGTKDKTVDASGNLEVFNTGDVFPTNVGKTGHMDKIDVISSVGNTVESSHVTPPEFIIDPLTNPVAIANQNLDSQTFDPAKAQAFLNSLIGQPLVGGGETPKSQPEKAVPVDQWTQLYPEGQRPDRIEAGLARLEPVTEGTPLSENEMFMAEIAAGSFGKHRNLYKLLREERRQKNQLQKQQQQQQKTNQKPQPPGQLNKQEKSGASPASLEIPMSNKRNVQLLVHKQKHRGMGPGPTKRRA